jgi:hypothetical protein
MTIATNDECTPAEGRGADRALQASSTYATSTWSHATEHVGCEHACRAFLRKATLGPQLSLIPKGDELEWPTTIPRYWFFSQAEVYIGLCERRLVETMKAISKEALRI